MDEGFGPDVLGHEIGVLAQAVAGALDLDDDGMMQKPVARISPRRNVFDHSGRAEVTWVGVLKQA